MGPKAVVDRAGLHGAVGGDVALRESGVVDRGHHRDDELVDGVLRAVGVGVLGAAVRALRAEVEDGDDAGHRVDDDAVLVGVVGDVGDEVDDAGLAGSHERPAGDARDALVVDAAGGDVLLDVVGEVDVDAEEQAVAVVQQLRPGVHGVQLLARLGRVVEDLHVAGVVAVERGAAVEVGVGPADDVGVAELVGPAVHVLGFESQLVGLPRGVEVARVARAGDALHLGLLQQGVDRGPREVDAEVLASVTQQTAEAARGEHLGDGALVELGCLQVLRLVGGEREERGRYVLGRCSSDLRRAPPASGRSRPR